MCPCAATYNPQNCLGFYGNTLENSIGTIIDERSEWVPVAAIRKGLVGVVLCSKSLSAAIDFWDHHREEAHSLRFSSRF